MSLQATFPVSRAVTSCKTGAAAAAAFTLLPSGSLRQDTARSPPTTASTSRPSAAAAWAARTCRRCPARTSSRSATWTGAYVDRRFARHRHRRSTRRNNAPARRPRTTWNEAGSRRRSTAGIAACRPSCPRRSATPITARCSTKQKNIDAVVIATPDHGHAVQALAAMDLGKHVYVQKPLCWSVEECRVLTAARRLDQGADPDGQPGPFVRRRAPGQRVHPVRRHRHGHRRARLDQPPARLLAAGHSAPRAAAGRMRRIAALEHERRDDARRRLLRHASRRPTSWPGTCSSAPRARSTTTLSTTRSTGAAGPTGAWAPSATWARISSTPRSGRWISTTRRPSRPRPRLTTRRRIRSATTTYYEFPAKGARPAVKMTWYDGGLLPPKPVEMGDEEFNKGGGVLFVGTKGKLLHDTYGFNPRLLPKSLHESTGTAAADLRTHQDQPRDELDRRHPRHAEDHQPVRVLGQAHRDHAAGRGGAECRQEDPLRRRGHEDHQRRRIRMRC